METCGTCKYWGIYTKDSDEDESKEIFRTCTRVIHDKKHRNRYNAYPFEPEEFEENEKYAKELLKETKAVNLDGSGYFSCLRTAEDFGCVLYERTAGH
jgi:hypothetical protein